MSQRISISSRFLFDTTVLLPQELNLCVLGLAVI